MIETRKVPVTTTHLMRATAFFDEHPTEYPTVACLLNQALRDAFPEMNPLPPEEADSRFNCDTTNWVPAGSDTSWMLDETGVALVKAFDETNQDRPGYRRPFPTGLLPAEVTLTRSWLSGDELFGGGE